VLLEVELEFFLLSRSFTNISKFSSRNRAKWAEWELFCFKDDTALFYEFIDVPSLTGTVQYWGGAALGTQDVILDCYYSVL